MCEGRRDTAGTTLGGERRGSGNNVVGPRQLCTLPGGDESGMNLKELEDEEEG
jgi:hypothetical protein